MRGRDAARPVGPRVAAAGAPWRMRRRDEEPNQSAALPNSLHAGLDVRFTSVAGVWHGLLPGLFLRWAGRPASERQGSSVRSALRKGRDSGIGADPSTSNAVAGRFSTAMAAKRSCAQWPAGTTTGLSPSRSVASGGAGGGHRVRPRRSGISRTRRSGSASKAGAAPISLLPLHRSLLDQGCGPNGCGGNWNGAPSSIHTASTSSSATTWTGIVIHMSPCRTSRRCTVDPTANLGMVATLTRSTMLFGDLLPAAFRHTLSKAMCPKPRRARACGNGVTREGFSLGADGRDGRADGCRADRPCRSDTSTALPDGCRWVSNLADGDAVHSTREPRGPW
ncbi:hypothetical protein B7C42_07221 [Nocardia cerradoensis]|uniref:Uncharacterized protein n=1 Tax=Nocardia cerradoensis TaxID=85688 RepID=A0A231GVL8_9NOCA|nr:hypothetical protein B7C42_07221 [Nocardia cerradoensis]